MKRVMASRFSIRQGVLVYVSSWWQLSRAMHSNGAVPQSGCELGGAELLQRWGRGVRPSYNPNFEGNNYQFCSLFCTLI